MPCPYCSLDVASGGTDAYVRRFGRRERRLETFHSNHVAPYFSENPGQDPASPTVQDGTYYTLVDAEKQVAVQTGLQFPDYNVMPLAQKPIVLWNASAGSAAPFPLYERGATYIWRAFPIRKQNVVDTYWSSLFRTQWDPSWEAANTGAVNFEYYCCHPYPDLGQSRAEWEISMNGDDFRTVPVVYDQWYTQVVTVTPAKAVTYYFNWPSTTASNRVGPITQDARKAQTNPALFFGDTLWQGERYCGILRGFQYYDALLTTAQITSEITAPGSVRTPWYLNLNPTPDDISDKSGNGHHPKWYSPAKATLWRAA